METLVHRSFSKAKKCNLNLTNNGNKVITYGIKRE